MTIFIGTDHRGFELKNKLVEYLQSHNIRVEDMGNYSHDPDDDYPVFANKVAEAVLQHPQDALGIVICGSGVGVSVAANRFRGIRCALGFDVRQVQDSRKHDAINVLAVAADFIPFELACHLVDIFRQTQPLDQDRYTKRIHLLDHP